MTTGTPGQAEGGCETSTKRNTVRYRKYGLSCVPASC